MTTFAVAFAEALEELGVRHAFGVTGGAISFFWSALGGTGIEVTPFPARERCRVRGVRGQHRLG
jgi:thiamine pyrophosphate-dependent acetolactate synthase large subunit-like protein